MNRVQLRALIELIDEYASNANSPYAEKREHLLNLCTEAERASLEEFVSWFVPEIWP